MSNANDVSISLVDYLILVDIQNRYNALVEAGVDNWVGYDYAMELYREGGS